MLPDKLVTVSGFVEGRLVGFDNSQEVLFTEESSVLDSLESLLLTSSGMFLEALTSLKTMFKIKLAMFSRLVDFKSSGRLQSITKY